MDIPKLENEDENHGTEGFGLPVSKEKRIDGVGIPGSKAKLPGPTAHRYTVQGCAAIMHG